MWKFYQPVNIIFGPGEIKNIYAHMTAAGLKKALIVADPFPAVAKIGEDIRAILGNECVGMITDVEPNPTVENVDNCAALARELGAECLVAVGGGSTIDCAKLAAAVAAGGGCAVDYMDGRAVTAVLPIVGVPTTAGTGSEVTAVSIVSDKKSGRKVSLVNPRFYPKLAVTDPELTYSCPKGVTASSGIDVMMHAVDAMSSVKANPATDALALRAAELVFGNLKTAVLDGSNVEARINMATASMLAGMAFSQTGTTGSHACSYYITATYHVPHGEACALTAHKWLPLNAKARPELCEFAKRLGFAGVDAMADALTELKRAIGLRMTLSDAGIPDEHIPEIARKCAAAGNAPNNVYPITPEVAESILRSL